MKAEPEPTQPDRTDAAQRVYTTPEQTVLVLQGGGALGAYQAGVYEAMHEAGIAPDWIVGTSIGAINGALIAGNPPEARLEALRTFWHRVALRSCGFLQVRIPDQPAAVKT